MVRALVTGAEGPGFNTACVCDFSKTLSFHPAGSGNPTLASTGVGEGGEDEEWHSTSVAQLSVQIGSLTCSHFSAWLLVKGQL